MVRPHLVVSLASSAAELAELWMTLLLICCCKTPPAPRDIKAAAKNSEKQNSRSRSLPFLHFQTLFAVLFTAARAAVQLRCTSFVLQTLFFLCFFFFPPSTFLRLRLEKAPIFTSISCRFTVVSAPIYAGPAPRSQPLRLWKERASISQRCAGTPFYERV